MQVEDNTQEVTANEDGMLSRRTLFIIGCAAVIVVTLLIIGIVMVFASGGQAPLSERWALFETFIGVSLLFRQQQGGGGEGLLGWQDRH